MSRSLDVEHHQFNIPLPGERAGPEAVEPGSPTDGEVYILPDSKTGASWGVMADRALAHYRDGVWKEIAPREGFIAYVKDDDAVMAFDGGS